MSERAFRLRQAVKAAGGNQDVATRSGMNLSTLNRYIAGRDMKASAMVKLAAACGVSLDWLAIGRGPMRPGDAPPQAAAPAEDPAKPDTRGLFGSIHIDKLAGCLEAAQGAFTRRGEAPATRRIVQVALVLYDALEAEEADLETLAQVVTSKPPDRGIP